MNTLAPKLGLRENLAASYADSAMGKGSLGAKRRPKLNRLLKQFGVLLSWSFFLFAPQITWAATAGNVIVLEQVGNSTGAEINIRQDGLSNFIGAESEIAQIERTLTFYSLGDFDGDGLLNSRVLNVSCGEGCTNTFRLLREGDDINQDGDNDDPGEAGDVDGDPNTNRLFYRVFNDDTGQDEIVFVEDDDPGISNEFLNARRERSLTLFNGSSTASTINGIDNRLSLRQDGDGNQTFFEINSDGSFFNQEIFGSDNKTRFQTGRSDQKQNNASLRFSVNGSNNAVASRIGTSETGQISDFTTIEVDFSGNDSVVQAVSDGLDNEIIVRGSFSNSTVDVGALSDNSEITVELRDTDAVDLSAFQGGTEEGSLGSNNSLEVDWRFGSGSSLGFLQLGTGNVIDLLNGDAGGSPSYIDIFQFGDGHQADITLNGGGQLVNIFQGPFPTSNTSTP